MICAGFYEHIEGWLSIGVVNFYVCCRTNGFIENAIFTPAIFCSFIFK
jgi:hypothetical protein